jgi:hypothetical protein
MGRKQENRLVDIVRRNWLYASPTPVIEDGIVTRYNLTIFASDYRSMMAIATAAGGFVMPRADRDELAKQFAAKARTAGGEYDLSKWNIGELAAAHDDIKGLGELADFDKAIGEEIKRRAIDDPARSRVA